MGCVSRVHQNRWFMIVTAFILFWDGSFFCFFFPVFIGKSFTLQSFKVFYQAKS
jgi:hypothetical protein